VNRSTTPPMYLANSTDELMPLQQLRGMRDALVAAGVRVHTQVIPGSRHAMEYTAQAFCPTVAFLERYLGPTTARCDAPANPPLDDETTVPASGVSHAHPTAKS
jgi:dienelactone hydrolase